jgi:hypothetical protein
MEREAVTDEGSLLFDALKHDGRGPAAGDRCGVRASSRVESRELIDVPREGMAVEAA